MRYGRAIVYAAILSVMFEVVGRVSAQAPAPQIVCVTGVIDGTASDGTPIQTVLDMLLAVPAAQDMQAATNAALQAAGARAPGSGDIPLVRQPFVLDGLSWPQFFDKTKLNNFVTQVYNPTGDPTGGSAVGPILNAQATWSAVRGSDFSYAYGGQTTLTWPRPLDLVNTISWTTKPSLGRDVLGVTVTTFRLTNGTIVRADIQLFALPGFPWHVDGQDFDVQTVMLHELGHALGLGHSPHPSSVMYAFYQGVHRTVDVIDTDALAFLYPAHPSNAATPQAASAPFRLVASLGDLAPGGFFFQQEFEVGDLNARGDASFASEVGFNAFSTFGEGLFVASTHGVSQLERSLLAAPGGGNFDASVLGRVTLNDTGDAGFASVLRPLLFPIGRNAGVYHWDSSHGALSAVVVPGVTPAPGGGVFEGAFGADIANHGAIVFGGIIHTTAGISGSLGMGVFGAAPGGMISTVAAPGTPAPGGGVFDFAGFPTIGGAGDIGFEGHLHGQTCLTPNPPTIAIQCVDGAYVKRHNGGIDRIAGGGDSAPGGGIFRAARSPLVNSRGDVVFAGDLTAPPRLSRSVGLFLSSGGSLTAVIRPGDALPGGGHLVTTNTQSPQFSFNDRGEVAFAATLDTDNGAGVHDTGVYVRTAGGLELIARTGTVVPGLGTIAHINAPSNIGSRSPTGGAVLNAKGDVLFTATLTDGLGVLLVAQR